MGSDCTYIHCLSRTLPDEDEYKLTLQNKTLLGKQEDDEDNTVGDDNDGDESEANYNDDDDVDSCGKNDDDYNDW